jgi:hypothetical protein
MVRPDLRRDKVGIPEISGPQERERERERETERERQRERETERDVEYPEGTSSARGSTVPSGEPSSQGRGQAKT